MPENGEHVIIIANSAQVEKQRRVAVNTQRRRRKKSAFQAMTGEIAQHPAGRPDGFTFSLLVIRNIVIEEVLDAFRTFQRTQYSHFARIEAVLALSH
jgi:hypothetical protein